MSIELTGPRGYEFQYIVTVYAALALIRIEGVNVESLYVERINSEDIELNYAENGISKSLEIQVKSESDALDMQKLVTWLCHFARWQSNNCILSRLLNEDNRTFIIVMSARCADDTANLLNSLGDFSKRAFNNNVEQLPFLLELPKQYEGSKTKLKKNRNSFCIELSKKLEGVNAFQDTIQKICVWELATKEKIIQEIKQLLNENYHVPQSQTIPLLRELLDVVRDGRDKSKNIISDLVGVVDKAQGARPVLSPDYISRPDEGKLLKALDDNGVLFLKGHSFCGKTNTGNSLSLKYYDRGYNFLITDNVDTAKNFLNSNIIEDRICFLDDPFGHLYDPFKSYELYKKTFELNNGLPNGRKLIVTCNTEVEGQVADATMPLLWYDLTVTDNVFAQKVWRSLVHLKSVPEDVAEAVTIILQNTQNGTLLFQPGQLDYIARSYQELTDLSEEAIASHAALDARRIVRELRPKDRDRQRIYRCLGLLASTIVPVSQATLQYVLSGSKEFPAIMKDHPGSMGISIFSGYDEDVAFPKYPRLEELTIDLDLSGILDEFEERGYLFHNNGDYSFKHPMYQQAAILLAQELPGNSLKSYFKELDNAISVIEVKNARIAVNQFEWIYSHYPALTTELFTIAYKACLSIFPSVQDKSYLFLLKHLKALDEETTEAALSWVAEKEWDLGYINWHNGEPFFADVGLVSANWLLKRQDTLSEEEFTHLSKNIESEQNEISPEAAWRVANYIKQQSKIKPLHVSEKLLARLLDFNESFIRQIAAFHVMYLFQNPPKELVDRIFSDVHPYVLFQGLKGSFRGWPNYSEQTREQVLSRLTTTINNDIVCLKAKNFMTQFGIGYTSYAFDWKYHIEDADKPAMWDLWSKLIPHFFHQLSSEVAVHQARFTSTMNDSAEILSPEQQMEVARGWLDWLSRVLDRHQYGNDNIFGLTNYFLQIADKIPEREKFSALLINHPSIHFACYNMRKFLEYWDELTNDEQHTVCTRLNSEKSNIYKAVALTAARVPEQVVELITGDSSIFTKDTHEFVTQLGSELLHNCLSVLFGDGFTSVLPYENTKVWHSVLKSFLEDISMPVTKLAVQKIFSEYLFSKEYGTRRWGDINILLTNLLKKENEAVNKFVLDVLLEDITSTTYSQSLTLWQIVKENASPQTFTEAKKKLLQNIEAVDVWHNMDIVVEIIDKKELEKELKADTAIRYLLKTSEYVLSGDNLFNDTDFEEQVSKTITNIVDQGQIRLHTTMQLIQGFISRYNLDHEGSSEIFEEHRLRILEKEKEQLNICRSTMDSQLQMFVITP